MIGGVVTWSDKLSTGAPRVPAEMYQVCPGTKDFLGQGRGESLMYISLWLGNIKF